MCHLLLSQILRLLLLNSVCIKSLPLILGALIPPPKQLLPVKIRASSHIEFSMK